MRKIRINNNLYEKCCVGDFYELNSDTSIDLEASGFIPPVLSDISSFNKRKKKRKL